MIDSEVRVSHRFRKREEMPYPKGRDKVIFEKKIFRSGYLFRRNKSSQP